METGEEPMLSNLRKQLGALKYLAKCAPKKNKLILANGLILSKILYLLPIYGGTHTKYMNKIQVIMNNTIRFVTGAHKRAKTLDLMKSVGWLDINKQTKRGGRPILKLTIYRNSHVKTGCEPVFSGQT